MNRRGVREPRMGASSSLETSRLTAPKEIPYLFAMRATITSKGQITIPVRIRRHLHLEPGDVLEFDESASCLLARPAFDEREMRQALGCARGTLGMTTSQWLEETRGPVAHPPETE